MAKRTSRCTPPGGRVGDGRTLPVWEATAHAGLVYQLGSTPIGRQAAAWVLTTWRRQRRRGASLTRAVDAAEYLHVAFAVAAADVGAWERRLLERGLAIERTIDWRPGVRSLYVRDPDQHLVEVALPGVWGDSL